MKQHTTIDRLSAYLDDELSAAERTELDSQLAASDSLREQLERLRKVRDWFREYPGRKPERDAWAGIAARLDAARRTERSREQSGPRDRRRGLAGLFFVPAFAWAGMSTAMKRIGIAALVAVALGGMGRQFMLERRARNLEQASELREAQLFRLASANRWSADAVEFRDRDGARFSLACPPGGQLGTVWGSDIYTDDSSICTAAVHSGAIERYAGGVVTFEIQGGLPQYHGTTRNGVESRDYREWSGSFVIVSGSRLPGSSRVLEGGTISWDASAIDLRGLNGTLASFSCPAGVDDGGPIWGTGVYTDDSAICTAAVHAGLITYEDGGDVTIEVVPGMSEYDGTLRNGVESLDYREWSGSFRFVTAVRLQAVPRPAPRPDARPQPNPQPRPNPVPRPSREPRPNLEPPPTPQPEPHARPQALVSISPLVILGLDRARSADHADRP